MAKLLEQALEAVRRLSTGAMHRGCAMLYSKLHAPAMHSSLQRTRGERIGASM
jgi:hypothetical protein